MAERTDNLDFRGTGPDWSEGSDPYKVEIGSQAQNFFARLGVLVFPPIIGISILAVLLVVNFIFSFTDWWPYINPFYIIIGTASLTLLFFIVSVFKGWTTVNESFVLLIELFDDYVYRAKPGLHIFFPWFGWIGSVLVPVYEQQMRLFMSEKVKEGFGYGDVEFSDGSAGVDATAYFQIIDPEKAHYNVGNIYKALEEKLDSAIRSFFGQYSIDDANKLKARVNLKNIMNNEYIKPESSQEPPDQIQHDQLDQELYTNSALYRSIKDRWGVIITALAISDIVYPDTIVKSMEKVYAARKEKEAQTHKSEARAVEGEGEKNYLENIGQGMRAKIENLKSVGLQASEAAGYDIEILKWQNVGDKTVIQSGQESFAGLGAQFAAGQSAFGRSNDTKNDSQSES